MPGGPTSTARMAGVAERVFPTVLEPLRSRDDVRALSGDAELFDALTTRPLGELIESVTTTTPCAASSPPTPSSAPSRSLGETDLRQNVCFLYHLIGGGTGDWDVPVGGMGALTDSLAAAAVSAGATILTGAEVTSVDPSTGEVAWSGGSAGAAAPSAAPSSRAARPPCSTGCSRRPAPSP